ncbi:hypothetical protein HMP09_2184 [Sphingomonas sp. HMP9]|nr:hypothetical protein HMP09_2184 [Sphingomonas sp. HMP9]
MFRLPHASSCVDPRYETGRPAPEVAAAQFAIVSRYGGKHLPRNGPWLSILHERLHTLPKRLHPAAYERAKAACGAAGTHILESNIGAIGFRSHLRRTPNKQSAL